MSTTNQKGYSDAQRRRQIKRKKAKRRRQILKTTFLLISICFLAAVAGLTYYSFNDYEKRLVVEAGSTVYATDFVSKGRHASFVKGEDMFDTSVPDSYFLEIRIGFFTHDVELVVEDTVAPVVTVEDKTISIGQSIQPEEFAAEIVDATETKARFANEPDYDKIGSQEVTILFTDLGENEVSVNANLLVSPFVDEITLEAGSPVPTVESLSLTSVTGTIVTEQKKIAMNHVGDCQIDIESEGLTYPCILHVEDTIAPVIRVKNVEGYFSAQLDGTEFIDTIEDATDITASFETMPDMGLAGTQQVTITFSDEGGNKVTESAMLTLQEDTEPPKIACAEHYQINVGDSILYTELVTVTDNCFDQYDLTIKKDTVDVNTEGTYTVTFIAVDAAGNQSTREMEIRVVVPQYSQETVDELADAVLNEITTASMTDREKAVAIYNWVTTHVRYINHSEKSDWLKAAYEALHDRECDCYGFAMVAKELLTRAGIKNMDIEKIPAASMHYWNLVDVGEGWLHFDTCPRRVAHNFCLITDAELMEYSDANNKSHNYDRNNYPDIN